MSRTLNQKMADSHELYIATMIKGRQPKGSGSQWHDQMDAKNGTRDVPFPIAADGKSTLAKSLTITKELWKKLQEQCFGEIPTWWGRFYRDESLMIADLDLVALEPEDFVRILEAARNWECMTSAHPQAEEVVTGVVQKLETLEPGTSVGQIHIDYAMSLPSEYINIEFQVAKGESGSGCECCR